jgi:hypothetical protein
VAWISSPSRAAASLRDKVGLLFSGKLHAHLFGDSTNRYVSWIGAHKHLLEWGAVATLAAIMLIVRLTLKSLIVYTFLLLLAVLIIEVIGGKPTEHVALEKRV